MKEFSIEVVSKEPRKINGLSSHEGKITIGDYYDIFIMPLTDWNLNNYVQQWKEGLERIRTHDSSCLVVTAQNIIAQPFILIWTLYKVSERVFLRQRLLNTEIAKILNPPVDLSKFTSKNCYKIITPRLINKKGEPVNRYGEKVAEWEVPLSIVENFEVLK